MAKMDGNAFKKNHFWFLFIPVAICALMAIFGVFGVAGETDKQLADNKTKKTAIDNTKVVPSAKSKLLEKNKEVLYSSLDRNWAVAWNAQKDVFAWPSGMLDTLRKRLADTKYGSDLAAMPEFRIFRDQFHEEYVKDVKKLPEAIAPMQFNGGLDLIVKYVKKMPTPTPEDMWLAMEDLWVQTLVVNTIDGVNKEIASFKPINPTPQNKTNRKFASRLWELDLSVGESEDRRERFLKGKLKNITDRLLPFGFDNVMILKVWLDADPRSEPFEFLVEGEHLAAGASIDIKTIPAHRLRNNQRVEELFRVEQVFDLKTVPVKRIDRLEIGYKADRQQSLPLKMAPFSEKALADATPVADPNAAPTPVSGGEGGMVGPGGTGMGGVNTTDMSPGGLIRKRYIDVTPQVRRLPLGFVVIAEQPYVNDIQVAMANAKLRFQITQSHVKRSRDVTAVTPPPPPEPQAGGVVAGPGGLPTGPGAMPGPGAVPAPGGLSLRGGEGNSPVGRGGEGGIGIGGRMPPQSMGNSGEGGIARPGMFAGPAGFSGGLESTNVLPPDQTSNNLVELGLYGVASLYEKFTSSADLAAQAAKDAAAPAEPKK